MMLAFPDNLDADQTPHVPSERGLGRYPSWTTSVNGSSYLGCWVSPITRRIGPGCAAHETREGYSNSRRARQRYLTVPRLGAAVSRALTGTPTRFRTALDSSSARLFRSLGIHTPCMFPKRCTSSLALWASGTYRPLLTLHVPNVCLITSWLSP